MMVQLVQYFFRYHRSFFKKYRQSESSKELEPVHVSKTDVSDCCPSSHMLLIILQLHHLTSSTYDQIFLPVPQCHLVAPAVVLYYCTFSRCYVLRFKNVLFLFVFNVLFVDMGFYPSIRKTPWKMSTYSQYYILESQQD